MSIAAPREPGIRSLWTGAAATVLVVLVFVVALPWLSTSLPFPRPVPVGDAVDVGPFSVVAPEGWQIVRAPATATIDDGIVFTNDGVVMRVWASTGGGTAAEDLDELGGHVESMAPVVIGQSTFDTSTGLLGASRVQSGAVHDARVAVVRAGDERFNVVITAPAGFLADEASDIDRALRSVFLTDGASR